MQQATSNRVKIISNAYKYQNYGNPFNMFDDEMMSAPYITQQSRAVQALWSSMRGRQADASVHYVYNYGSNTHTK